MLLDTTTVMPLVGDTLSVNTISANSAQLGGITLTSTAPALSNNAVVYESLVVPAMAMKPATVSPEWIGSVGGNTALGVYAFDGVETVESLQFMVQLPRSWKIGSTLYPIAYFTPTDKNSADIASRVVRFTLEYAWVNLTGAIGASASINLDSAGFVPNTSQWKVLTANNATGIAGTGKTLSSVLLCSLSRDGASATDTYPQDAGLIAVSFAYTVDAMGSTTLTAK